MQSLLILLFTLFLAMIVSEGKKSSRTRHERQPEKRELSSFATTRLRGYGGYGCGHLGFRQCGGFAGIPCPTDFVCVDDPRDDCNPFTGGADCIGICVPGDFSIY